MKRIRFTALVSVVLIAAVVAWGLLFHKSASAAGGVPKFEVDPYWPKQLPNNWMLGGVGGIFVDSHDDIWVANRPRSSKTTTGTRPRILRRPIAACPRLRCWSLTRPAT